MRAIVCGGRYYNDAKKVTETLLNLGVLEIAEGGATGADALSRKWARYWAVPCTTFEADWTAYGNGAGPIRNGRMLHEFRPDAVIAFAGGRGTADMVRQAKEAGVRVIEVSSD